MQFDEIENHVCPNCGCADVRTLHRIDDEDYFDDDGGDGVTEGDMSDNMLYAGTIG